MDIDSMYPAVIDPLYFDSLTYEFVQSPKQLEVDVLNVHKACELNAEWHSRFPVIKWPNVVRNKRYVCFSAHDQHLIYAVAIWSSPIAANRLANGAQMLELRRMAIAEYSPKNTATFMLKRMRNWIFHNFEEIETLISYQDVEAHHGTIYKADNWVAVNMASFVDWSSSKRKRAEAQSTAPKIRWEFHRKQRDH